MTPIMGTFVKLQTMADGTPRVVLDMQCKLEEVTAMGLTPGAPFALARLATGVLPKQEEPKQAAEKPGQLCVMACTFCEDANFRHWVSMLDGCCNTAEEAKQFILFVCGVTSRKYLDFNKEAAQKFHSQIREPYLQWKQQL